MSGIPPQPPAPLSRDRERTVQVLCRAFADDLLTLEEFESRLDHAYTADSLEQLTGLLAGLPDPTESGLPEVVRQTVPRAPAHEVRERGLQVAIMGGSDRKGVWTPPRHLYTVALMGGAGLDFREARFPPGVTEVTVVAIMGGVEIIVPPGLGVQTHGIGLMGGFDALDQTSSDPANDAPLLRIRGLACMGGIEVKVRLPGETAKEARRRVRAQGRRRLRGGSAEE